MMMDHAFGLNYQPLPTTTSEHKEHKEHKSMKFENLRDQAADELSRATVSFPEGQSLLVLVPFEHRDLPWLPVATVQFPDTTGLKRSVVVTNSNINPIIDSPHFRAMAREHGKVLGVDNNGKVVDVITDAMASPRLGGKAPRQTTIYLYVALVLARRSNPKGTWSGIHVTPQVMLAKKGGRQTHLHDGVCTIISQLASNEVESLFLNTKAEKPVPVRGIIVERTGSGRLDTTWKVMPCTGKQAAVDSPELGAAFVGESIVLPPSLIKKVAAALQSGGDCDLIKYAASTFLPTAEEQGTFLSKLGMGPRMSESEVAAAAAGAGAGDRADG